MNHRDIPSPDIRLLDVVRIGPPTEDHRRDNPLSGQRTQVLAARLLMDRRRPASCDELAEVIWGEKLPKTWHAALRGLVSKVRRAVRRLGEGNDVVATGNRYAVRLAVGVTVDVDMATGLLLRSKRSRAAESHEPTPAEIRWAHDTLSAPFLPGVDSPWANAVRQQIERDHLNGLLEASRRQRESGSPGCAVEAARQAVSMAPLSDAAAQTFLLALAVANHRDLAIQEFHAFRRRVDGELGVPPDPETQRIYLEVLGRSATVNTLPRAGNRSPNDDVVIGLERLLVTAERSWAKASQGRGGVLHITGEPGSGKSTSLQEIVRRLTPETSTVVQCDPWMTSASEPALVRALRLVAPDETQAPTPSSHHPSPGNDIARWCAARLRQLTESGPVLLVIDDVETCDETTRLALCHLLASRHYPPGLMVLVSEATRGDSLNVPLRATLPQASPWYRSFQLRPWSVDEVRSFLTAVGRDSDLDASLVHRRGGGSPFLTQLLATSWEEPVEEVQAIAAKHFDSRCEGLTRQDRTVLQSLAVMGGPTEKCVLECLLGLEADQVATALSTLDDQELVAPTPLPSDVGAGMGVDVMRALDREVLLSRARPAWRRELLRRLPEVLFHHAVGSPRLYARHLLEGPALEHVVTCPSVCQPALLRTVEDIVARHESVATDLVDPIIRMTGRLSPGESADLKIRLARLLLKTQDPRGKDLLLEVVGEALSSGNLSRAMEAAQVIEECHRRAPETFAPPGVVLDIVAQRVREAGVDLDCFRAARFTASVVRHGDYDIPEYAFSAALATLSQELHGLGATPGGARRRSALAEDLWAVAVRVQAPAEIEQAVRHGLAAAAMLNDATLLRRFDERLASCDGDWVPPIREEWATLLQFWGRTPGQGCVEALCPRMRSVARWVARTLDPTPTPMCVECPCSGRSADSPSPADRLLDAVLTGRRTEACPALRLLVPSQPEAHAATSLHDVGILAIAAAELEDRVVAERLTERLSPFADFSCGDGLHTSVGPVALHLGRLARSLGRMRAARDYFEHAREVSARMEQPTWLAMSMREDGEKMERIDLGVTAHLS